MCLALQCCRHKEKEREKPREVNRGDEERAKGMRQVRRGVGEEERKLGRRRREYKRRLEGTGYAVSLKNLRGSAGRGRDRRRG